MTAIKLNRASASYYIAAVFLAANECCYLQEARTPRE